MSLNETLPDFSVPTADTQESTDDLLVSTADFMPEGIHEAVFTIVNDAATKELVEETVLSRQAHLRNGEVVSLVERDDVNVIHQQFHTLVSVQSLLADLNHRGIAAGLEFTWGN